MRIGHTLMTHRYLMRGMTGCEVPLTIKHIVTECFTFETERREAGIYNILSEVLHPDNLLYAR